LSNKSGYKKQKSLSTVQLLAETPWFIANLVSAIFSGTILLYVDLLDSLSYIIRNAMVILLSGKLSKDLRYEYNYGVGKVEAVSSLFGDGIVLFGMFLTMCLSGYSFFYPSKPSAILIGVVGMKLYDIMWDIAIFNKQRKILKLNKSALSETNYAAAFGDLLFDSVTFGSLFIIWLLRNSTIGGYISPFISILVALYLSAGCIKRIKSALAELTDKTLPEEQQMKILNILIRYFNSYSQVHAIDSRKIGDTTMVDIHLSFEKDTSVEHVVKLQTQMQEEFDRQIGDCIVKINVREG
jgi:divalent metal cation (Fe/Co/Zn/Cd) transporter